MAAPAEGELRNLIDLHCHLLPAIDDGCSDLTQTLVCITSLRLSGFVGAALTPHIAPRLYPRNKPSVIARWVESLVAQLRERDVDYQLWTGGEVRISDKAVEWMREHGVPTLGSSRCVLIDWWGREWASCCQDVCEFLLAEGYQPILAHPERMGLDPAPLLTLLDDLQRQGIWLQGNLNSFTGAEGPEARELARTLLKSARYTLLATDTHGPDSVDSRRRGLRIVRQEFGDGVIRRLLVDAPRRILQMSDAEPPTDGAT